MQTSYTIDHVIIPCSVWIFVTRTLLSKSRKTLQTLLSIHTFRGSLPSLITVFSSRSRCHLIHFNLTGNCMKVALKQSYFDSTHAHRDRYINLNYWHSNFLAVRNSGNSSIKFSLAFQISNGACYKPTYSPNEIPLLSWLLKKM